MKLQNINNILRTTYPHSSVYALPIESTSKTIDSLNFRLDYQGNQAIQKGFQIIL